MRLLIDGYNLVFTAGIPGRGHGIGAIERSRLGLLRFLVESLETDELPETVVVFDGRDAPPGLPRQLEYHGITVRFAPRDQSADAVIDELIEGEPSPGRLTVVSSDREVQRAARRRRARAVDSQTWHDQLARRRSPDARPPTDSSAKPSAPLLPEEVREWLDKFGEAIEPPEATDPLALNPFPPGYAEDLEDQID